MIERLSLEEATDGHTVPERIEIMEIEIAHLELRYAHTRFHRPEAVSSLAASVDRSYRISPVVTIKEGDLQFVLIDGYLRVAALKLCRMDTVAAEIWHCLEWEALLRVLMRTGERKWEVLEEALLIRELRRLHGLSEDKIAHLVGRDKSWVSRRLSLFSILPDEILDLVRQGYISLWAASRVLTPLARANPGHAKVLAQTLVKESVSTRELMKLFVHYRKANRKQREKMVAEPVLFLKALQNMEEDNKAGSIREGPEGRWLKDMKAVGGILGRLRRELPNVIYRGQGNLQRRLLLTAFEDGRKLFTALEKDIRGVVNEDHRRDEASHFVSPPAGDLSEGDQPAA